MNDISGFAEGINELDNEVRYIPTVYTINQWPTTYKDLDFKTTVIKFEKAKSLEEFIEESKDKGLSHIVIDNKEERPIFMQEIFFEEKKYNFLEKVYDSKKHGFDYHVKVFKIDYNLFN